MAKKKSVLAPQTTIKPRLLTLSDLAMQIAKDHSHHNAESISKFVERCILTQQFEPDVVDSLLTDRPKSGRPRISI